MQTILHLSDIHISLSNDRELEIVTGALIDDLEPVKSSIYRPQFVAITGDLVQDGSDYQSYLRLEEVLVEPIKHHLGLESKNIILVPGNHDVDNTYIQNNTNHLIGLRSTSSSRDDLNGLYTNGKLKLHQSHAFKNFIDLQDSISENSWSNEIYNVSSFEDSKIDFLTINTALLSKAGHKPLSDFKELKFPEYALRDAMKKLNGDHIKVLLSHHPLDWMNSANSADLGTIIAREFDFHLFGHNHEAKPRFTRSPDGEITTYQAGALLQGSRKRYIGYQLISIATPTLHSRAQLRTYFDSRGRFSAGEDIAQDGIFFPSNEASRHWNTNLPKIDEIAFRNWLKKDIPAHYDKLLNEALTEKGLMQVFVCPKLKKIEPKLSEPEDLVPESDNYVDFDKLCSLNKNYIIIAAREYGKTSLLKKIASNIIHNSETVIKPVLPVILNAKQIEESEVAVERAIRGALPELPPNTKLKSLLEEGRIALLIDDIDAASPKTLRSIDRFISVYEKVTYFVTGTPSTVDLVKLLPKVSENVDFDYVEICEFRRSELRSFINGWSRIDQVRLTDDITLNKIFDETRALNLPMTAVTATIMMVTYQNPDRPNIFNKANLIERYVEIMLEKYSGDQLITRSFDFRNRQHFLAYLAKELVLSNSYEISRNEFLTLVGRYAGEFGFELDHMETLNGFLKSRVLSELDGVIRFRFNTYQEYFTAIQMQDDAEFLSYITHDDRYLQFQSEIEFYAGMGRGDTDLLSKLLERFLSLDTELMTELGDEPDLDVLDKIRLGRSDGTAQASNDLDQIRDLLGAHDLSDSERDEALEAELPFFISRTSSDERPKVEGIGNKWVGALTLLSAVLKQSDFVKDSEKEKALQRVFFGWGKLVALAIPAARRLAEAREMKVNGLTYKVMAPDGASTEDVERFIISTLPVGAASMLSYYNGTEKLSKHYKNIAEDEPGIVTFMKAAMLADLSGFEIGKRIKPHFEHLGHSRYFMESFIVLFRRVFLRHKISDEDRVNIEKIASEAVQKLGGKPDRTGSKGRLEQKWRRADMKLRIGKKGD